MKKLIIDMDDVLCEKGYIRMVNEFLGTHYKEEDAKSYFINDLIPQEKMQEWVKFFNEKNLYDYVDLTENVLEVLEKLNEKYDIYIVTAYIFRDDRSISGKTLERKYRYLYEKFPFIDPGKYIFTTNKDIVEADIRIDDKVKKMNGKADMKLLFTAYHNKDITDEELTAKGITRVSGWKEIESILL